MRQKLLLLLLLLAAWGARAQAPTWQSALSSAAVDVRDVAINSSGDVYVTGSYTGTVTFGPNTLTSTGDQDMFVAKWASGASTWAWGASGGGGTAGSSGDANDYGNSIAVNGTRVYVAGVTRSTSFVSGSGSLTNGGLNDMFVARFTDNGGTVAASGLFGSSGGASSEYAYGLAVNSTNGNVYVTGYFGSTSLPNVTISGSSLVSGGSADVYVAKYFDNGTTMSNGGATRAGGASGEIATCLAMNGNTLYVGGRFNSTGTAIFGSSTLTNGGANDIFVARFSDTTPGANGGIVANNALRGGGDGADAAEGIAVNAAGSIYVTGYVTSATAGVVSVAGSTLTPVGGNDIFVAKYTDSGSALVNGYAIADGGANTENGLDGSIGADIAVNGSQVYVTSDYLTSTTIAGTSLTSAGGYDAFVAKYTDTGSTFAGNGALSGGGSGDDSSYGIAVNGTQGVVGGKMVPTANFGTALTSGNAYVARVNFAAAPTVTTAAATSVTINSAVLGGNVTSDGGDAVTGRGVVYSSTATTPAIGGGGVTQAVNGAGTGTFSATIASLTPGTTYYVRAYAINSIGTSYGSVVTFTTSSVVIAPTTLPGGTVGTAYSQTITASGGTAPYTYAITAGALPAGLSLASNGTLSGTPTAGGSFSFTVRATDASASPGPYSGTQAYTLTIGAATISLSPATLPGGTVGAAYSQTIVASGGTAPYTYSITAGALPAGLVLTSGGVLSGTPTAGGSFNFTVRAVDSSTGSGPYNGTRGYTLTIASPTIVVAPATLPNGTQGTAYSQTIGASGGTAPYSFAVTAGALPNGLTLASNGTLSGTPTVANSFTFTVTATDASTGTGPFSGSRSYTVTIVSSTTTVSSVTRLTPSPTATAQVSYRVVFAASVTGVTVSNFTITTTGSVSGTSVSSVSGAGTTYTVVVNTGTGSGTLRLDVANGTGITPTVSNVPYTTGETYTITKSFAAAPQLTIVGTGGTGSDVTAFVDVVQVLNGGSPFANGLQNGSFETHGALANGDFGYNPTGATWTFNAQSGIAESGSAFTPTTPIPNGIAVAFVQSNGGGNGQLQQNLAVPTGTSYQVSFQAAQRICCTTLDQALNVFLNGVFVGTIQPGTNGYSTFTSATFSVTAPALTATVSTTSASPTSTSPIPFSVSFSQSVGTTFTASDVTVTGGTLTGGSFSGSGAGPYTFTVTPTGTGTVSVSLAAGIANDANNTGNTASNTVSVQYQLPATAAPVVLMPANGSLLNTTTPTYAGTAPAGSTVTVFVDGSSIGTTTTTGTGNWSLSQPTALSQGSHTVYATAQSSGSAVSANSNTNTFTIDTVRPTVAISSSAGASGGTTGTSPIPFTVTFSEAVTGFVTGDLTVTNGTVSGFSGSGTTYTFNVTPTTAGTATTVNVPANVAQDQASNGNTAAVSAYSLTFTAPTITVNPATLPNGTTNTAYSQTITASGGTAPYTYAITAGALPTGLTLTSGGVLSGTPTANGSFTFTVTATDAAAAPGPYSGSRSYSLTISTQPVTAAPTVVVPGNGSVVNTTTPTYQGTAAANSTVTVYVDGVSIGTTTATAGGSFTLAQPTALAQGVRMVYATAQSSGSAVSANSSTNSFTVDTVQPTVAITSTAGASGGTTPTSPIPFTVTFSEAVTGFVAGDLTVTNGTVSGFTAVSGTVYTFNVTPTTAGTATTVHVPANVAQDAAGNGNTAAPAAYSLTFTAPTITVAPATLPNGTQGAAYSQTLTASGGTAPYTYAITSGALPAGLNLTGNTISGTPTASGTYNFRVTATDNSAAPGPYSGFRDYTLTIGTPTSVAWNGSISTDWFTANNWTPNVLPDATIDAIVPTAPSGNRFPVISAGTGSARNLTLNSGASLTQTGGTLVLAANLTNNGNFNATGGTVSLGGTTQSNILGSSNTRFWNLTVGASGAQQSTSASTSVQRLMTLNGNFTTNGNSFTLLSDATNTAMVVNNGSSVISGNATVQRYIAPDLNAGLGYRHYSAPVNGATVGSLATGSFSPVVNPAYNTSATPTAVTQFPTVYGYDQTRLATTTNNLAAFDKGWFSPNSTADPLTVGQGYTVNLAANQTFSVTGAPNNGLIALNLARNSGATAADAGWALVGNPYPAPLDYSLVAPADRPNLDAAIYVFESTSQYLGTYRANVNGVGGNANSPDPILAQGQGFFVRVSSGQTSGTLTLRNSQRLTAYANPVYHRSAETRPLVQLDLHSATGTDPVYVYFQNGATAGVDREFDAVKLPNSTGLNVSAETGTQRLAINALPALGTATVTVPLTVGVPAAGSYSFNAAQLLNLSTTPVYLRDLQSGAVIDLARQPSYPFTVSNASALISGRFELVFSPQAPLATAPAALAAQVGLYPNPAKSAAFVELPAALGRTAVTATLVDALGRVVSTQTLPAQGAAAHSLSLAELATGVYTLHLATSAGVLVKKLVVE